MAAFHWPELHRLLGTYNKIPTVKRKATKGNPHIDSGSFTRKLQTWKEVFSKDVVDVNWHWLRYENQEETQSTHMRW